MEKERWIESKSKIPFIGIVGIVIIVAIVAIFIRIQLGPFFPSSNVEIKDSASSNSLTGRASSSFIGVREIDLARKEKLTGVLNLRNSAKIFTIDVAEQSMTIGSGKEKEEVILNSDGQKLSAVFDYNSQKTRVEIDLSSRNLYYNEVDKMSTPIIVSLANTVTYEGTFKLNNNNELFVFDPSSDLAIIRGSDEIRIPLKAENEFHSGNWQDGKTTRPVVVNMKKLQATIEEVY